MHAYIQGVEQEAEGINLEGFEVAYIMIKSKICY